MESCKTAPSDYDPSLEWPGSDVDSDFEPYDRNTRPTSQHQTCFRLVVKSSAVLARKRRVAVLDAYEQVQIGRDASTSEDIPRIRLRDMEVSKLHATLFWDRERKEWALVDMGSKHGTFLKSTSRTAFTADENDAHCNGSILSAPGLTFARLSPARQASMPRALRHSDELSLGSTAFVVHVHQDGLPCDECRSEGDFDIPLFSVPSKVNGRTQKSVQVAEEQSKTHRDVKSAMTLLKKSLLSRHAGSPSKLDGSSLRYIDRSARRRALHPYSRSNSPPPARTSRLSANSSASATNISLAAASSSGTSFAYDSIPSSIISAPPTPISDANVGHRLLEKQGWVPGSTLGVPTPRSSSAADNEEGPPVDERTALSEPLQIAANIGRRGLGIRTESSRRTNGAMPLGKNNTTGAADRKFDFQRRRWDEVGRKAV